MVLDRDSTRFFFLCKSLSNYKAFSKKNHLK